jgi:hypothetical protein
MRTSYGLAAELKRTPDLSDNWLAQILGTTDKTVAAVRQELIATSRPCKRPIPEDFADQAGYPLLGVFDQSTGYAG